MSEGNVDLCGKCEMFDIYIHVVWVETTLPSHNNATSWSKYIVIVYIMMINIYMEYTKHIYEIDDSIYQWLVL